MGNEPQNTKLLTTQQRPIKVSATAAAPEQTANKASSSPAHFPSPSRLFSASVQIPAAWQQTAALFIPLFSCTVCVCVLRERKCICCWSDRMINRISSSGWGSVWRSLVEMGGLLGLRQHIKNNSTSWGLLPLPLQDPTPPPLP